MRGRPVNQETKLGRLIRSRSIPSYDLCSAAGVSPRTMTEYLAGRQIIREHHLLAMCEFLQVPAEAIVEENLTEDLTDRMGMPKDKSIASVTMLHPPTSPPTVRTPFTMPPPPSHLTRISPTHPSNQRP